jgi:hypothetical protein
MPEERAAPSQALPAAHDTDPLDGLDDTERALAAALASGARWKDAALAAGLPSPSAAFRLYQKSKRLKSAIQLAQVHNAQHLALADARLDVLQRVLVTGDDKLALMAARQVGDGLGLSGRRGDPRTRVDVAVNVAIGAVLQRPDVLDVATDAPLDAWVTDAQLVTADD